MRPAGASVKQATTFALAVFGCLGCVAWYATLDHSTVLDPLVFVLASFALVTNLMAAKWDQSLEISGSLTAALVAAAFVGPAAAFVVVVLAEAASWAVERLRPIAFPLNLLGLGVPALLAGTALSAFSVKGPEFFGVLTLAAAIAGPLNILIVVAIGSLHDDRSPLELLRAQGQMLPVWGLNVAAIVAIAGVYAGAGLPAAALVLVGIVGFTYQSRLVAMANERARRYAALSWGVLSGTLRNLDMRDSRTARHSAAVAMFARDIAAAAGMSEADQEVAHTAGLLHDVGKFALSDRVMEADVALTETDWKAIRRHPEIGAEMLQDLGVYGNVAEIVLAHHERIDGRGYPNRLSGDQIPELAKIVAVAEVYDTLTADDTYRAPLSSFQALTELRRVSGSQVEGPYVEALAQVLEGTGVEYRHAAAADFDRELDVERRIGRAATG
jgi:putative nucleotidyltransferase with HDIG domain